MMPREIARSLPLVVAIYLISALATAQTSGYGHWVNDPKNIATPGFVYDVPPAGFDPLTASDVELEQWGFPPRPGTSNAAAFARWKRMAGLARVTPQLTFTNVYSSPARNVGLGSVIQNITNTTSDVWSGAVLSGADHTFSVNETLVEGGWNIPSAAQAVGTCNTTEDYAWQWVGFDGWGSNDVLQAGTEADSNCSSKLYSAWYEWYPNAETRVSSPAVGPGDEVEVQVWYTTTSPYGHAYWADYRTGASASVAFNPPSGTTYEGNSAEWIVERPTVSGSPSDLANYGSMTMVATYARIGTATFYSPSSAPSGATSLNVSMTCPPWNPSSSCTTTTTISASTLFVLPGSIEDVLYFYDLSPAF
jgi:hypothetical protein